MLSFRAVIIMNKKIQRNPSLDIIRCCAFFFVVSVHFFLNSGYYGAVVTGERMYIMTLLRSFLMICVPLFILLSGYLLCNKTIHIAFYRKLLYTVSIYLLSSVCCVLYRILILKEPLSPARLIEGFFEFSNAPYSWYVEMYIGLFLMIPFLNLIYNNLKSRKEKHFLLAVFLFLTVLPNAINIFVPNAGWFLNPASNSDYFEFIPNYWCGLFPITYYFLGCYLREYKLPFSCKQIALLSVVVILLNGTFCYYRSYNALFIWGIWSEYNSLPVVIQAVLFFAFFEKLDYSSITNRSAKILSAISELCFGAYLVSWIFDDVFYKILIHAVPEMYLRYKYFLVIVPTVFICSLLLSFVVNFIYRLGAFCIQKLCSRRSVKITQ